MSSGMKDPSDGESARRERLRSLEKEILTAERKLGLIRRKQKEIADWDRSRRPIRIGFFIVIPIVLLIEAVHLYLTFDRTQGARRAPWFMFVSLLALVGISWWYYRQARSRRDRVFRGFDRAALYADDLERRIADLRTEVRNLKSGPGSPDAV